MFAKLISMAKTPEEVKQDAPAPVAVSDSKVSGPKYPWGLCISLDDETLKKLGLSGDLPAVGEVIPIQAMAKVTSASMNEQEKGDGTTEMCCRVELQITDMAVPDPEPDPMQAQVARRKRFYGSMVQDNDNDGE
jgi:hypothetical protein